jgi:hypothetical protein
VLPIDAQAFGVGRRRMLGAPARTGAEILLNLKVRWVAATWDDRGR